MKRLLILIPALFVLPALAADQQWTLSADAWYAPRDGDRVIRMQAVRESVRAWMKSPEQRLVIHYPGGEEGTLWARELRDWLVSLGIPSGRINTVPGLSRQDAVIIALRSREELE